MSTQSLLSKWTVCRACYRSLSHDPIPQTLSPISIQRRGKKKTSVVNVRLLVDTKGYGKKGTITPVATGLMRNVWFHRQIAEYISTARDIDPKTVVAQRDFAFSMSDEEMERQAKRSAELRRLAELKRSIKPKIKLLSAEETTALLTTLLPQRITIHKAAISTSDSSRSQSPPTSSPIVPAFAPKGIFGSVTPSEIAMALTTALHKHPSAPSSEDVLRIVIQPEDITITGRADVDYEDDFEIAADATAAKGAGTGALSDGQGGPERLGAEERERRRGVGVEDNRIKALGEYWIDIRVRGPKGLSGASGEKAKLETGEGGEQEVDESAAVDVEAQEGVVRRVVRVE